MSGRVIRFTIPYPATSGGRKDWCKRYGMNALYAGLHWAVRKKNADYWHELTRLSMQRAALRKAPVPYPVKVVFYYDDRLDCDNHAYISKMVVDGMKGWLIEDDSRRYVRSVENRFWDEPSGVIGVELREVKL